MPTVMVYLRTTAKWYRMAAEQGNAEAQTLLGALYCLGKGVFQSDSDRETLS